MALRALFCQSPKSLQNHSPLSPAAPLTTVFLRTPGQVTGLHGKR